MTSLRIINFGHNNLHGTLPPELCNQLPLLEGLNLNGNQLEGSIPKSIINCTLLTGLYLGDNLFTGKYTLVYMPLFFICLVNFVQTYMQTFEEISNNNNNSNKTTILLDQTLVIR